MDLEIAHAVLARIEGTVFPFIRPTLRNIVLAGLTPQLKGLPSLTELQKAQLVDAIVQRYRQSLMAENEPAGIVTAQTISENLTQSSLSSHHHAGLQRGAVGYERMEELTDLTDTGRCRVITTPLVADGQLIPRSKEEIFSLSNTLIKILLRDLVVKKQVMSLDKDKGVDKVVDSHPAWYKLLYRIRKKPENPSRTWLRLELSKDLLYRYRIPLSSIADAVGELLAGESTVLYSPIQLGAILDIHTAVPESKAKIRERIGQVMALQVGGIPSVESAYPQYENLLERLMLKEVEDDTYEVISAASAFVPDFVWAYMIRSMVPDAIILPGHGGRRFQSSRGRSRLERMILQNPLKYGDVVDTIVGYGPDGEQVDIGATRYVVTFTEYVDSNGQQVPITDEFPYLDFADLSPREFATRSDMEEFLLEMLVERHFFWYIEAICFSVSELFVLPEVDASRSYTTSPHDCNKSLGYLVMRQMLYDEMKANIQVNPLWIKTLVNMMTAFKIPVAIRRQSIRNDRTEWMTYTTFEDVLSWITAAAFVGESDSISSISARVITGRPIDIGRGGENLLRVNKFAALKKRSDEESLRRKQRQPGTRGSQPTTEAAGRALPASATTTAQSS